jgi:hypothetical protein
MFYALRRYSSEPPHSGTLHRVPGPTSFKENIMNVRKNDTEKHGTEKDDESVLERVAKTIAPPSREVSDAELIDPGANAPAPKPDNPAKSRSSVIKRKTDGDDPRIKRDK